MRCVGHPAAIAFQRRHGRCQIDGRPLARAAGFDQLEPPQLVERIVDFEVDPQIERPLKKPLHRPVDLPRGPAGVPVPPQDPPGEDRLAEFLILGLLEQPKQDPGVIVEVLEVQAPRQPQLMLVLGRVEEKNVFAPYPTAATATL